MDIAIMDTPTTMDTVVHLDSLRAAAKELWEDWQAAAQGEDEEAYEAGRFAYEEAYNELEVALGEAWDLPSPWFDAPIRGLE